MPTAPYMAQAIPGSHVRLEQQREAGIKGIEEAQKQHLNEADIELKKAQASFAGGKTPQEQDMRALQNTINPETLPNGPKYDPTHPYGRNHTVPESYEASATPGKSAAVHYAMDRVKSGDAENFAEGLQQYQAMMAGTKPRSAKQEEIDNYIKSHGGDTQDSTARTNAIMALDGLHASAKANATLPIQERKAVFQQQLDIEKQQLASSQNKSLEYGKAAKDQQMKAAIVRADDKKATDGAMQALDSGSSFGAAITPIMALLGATRAEQVKRVNKQELDRFMPGAIGFKNWATAHADAFVNGDIPEQYRADVRSFVNGLDKSSQGDYQSKLDAINNVYGSVGEEPVPKKGGGLEQKARPVTPAAAATTPGTPASTSGMSQWKSQNKKPLVVNQK